MSWSHMREVEIKRLKKNLYNKAVYLPRHQRVTLPNVELKCHERK